VLIGLPIAVFLLMAWAFYRRAQSLRLALIMAAVWWAVLLALITETLGSFGALRPPTLGFTWFTLAVMIGVPLALRAGSFRLRLPKVDGATIVLLSSASLISILVFVAAVIAPPNVWDSMEYHLPRVVQWALRGSVGLYPTPDYQQLMAPPFAEWVVMHFQVLSGGDRFAGLVQAGSFGLSAIAASLIAKFLGATGEGQALALLLSATIPQGVLSASGTKNDWVLALWLSCAAALILALRDRPGQIYVVSALASLGLACLTKGTAFLLAPFLVAGCAGVVWNNARKISYGAIAGGLLLALAINVPQFVRNFRLSGSILGFPSPDNSAARTWRNERMGPALLLSNLLRNVALHAGTPSGSLNRGLTALIRRTITAAGANPDDPAVTWNGNVFGVNGVSKHEIFAGNPLHLFLFVLVSVLMLKRTPFSGPWWLYWLWVSAAFVAFCALFKWQAFSGRFHLPFFTLLSALCCAVLTRCVPKPVWLTIGMVFALVGVSCATLNTLRPMIPERTLVQGRPAWGPTIFTIPRDVQYFADQHLQLAQPYIDAINEVNATGCRRVGIDASKEHYEYPLFAMLDSSERSVESWYVNVTNRTAVFRSDRESQPVCAVVCPNCKSDLPENKILRECGCV
jgi:hypothetical protein